MITCPDRDRETKHQKNDVAQQPNDATLHMLQELALHVKKLHMHRSWACNEALAAPSICDITLPAWANHLACAIETPGVQQRCHAPWRVYDVM